MSLLRLDLWKLCVCVFSIPFLTGCELHRASQPPVLMIAVEGLGFDQMNCDVDETEDQPLEGPRVFCQEAVRFSHAYAPSTMAQPTMASLMTGLYPFDHGVHNNGSDYLSAKFHTLAEGALTKGYRTLFVSGGAPIWRKSGLAQGFETFDDTMDLGLGVYYRPADEVFKLAINWFEQIDGAPFFTVLFLSDLQFPQVATQSLEGEIRERSSEGQLAAISESLGTLVAWLKEHKRWNSTHVVLVGLNSLAHREGESEPPPLSLRSSSVQVTLFIKPARRESDNVIQWAVDRNVSLVDVGRTMFAWLGLEAPVTSIPELAPVNLNAALTQSEPDWRADRLVASETAWPDWLEGSGTRWAVRQNQFLYIHDQHPLIFNTLTDRMESLPLRLSDPLWLSYNAQVNALFNRTQIPRFEGMHRHWLDEIARARELWLGGEVGRKTPHGEGPWDRWYLRQALARRDWREVRRLATEIGEPIGVFAAERGLGANPPVPRNPCLHLVLGGRGDGAALQSLCEDEKLLALHAWQIARTDEERKVAQERFLRIYSTDLMDQEIGRMNFLGDLRWDVDREWPEAPSNLDYVLTLKEIEPWAKKASAFLNGKNFTF